MHIKEERKLLLAFSLVFAVVAFALFGYGMTTKAEENIITASTKYFVDYTVYQDNTTGTKTWTYTGKICSNWPIIAWYQDTDYQLYQGLVDVENGKLYYISSSDVTDKCHWEYAKTDVADNEKGTSVTTVDLEFADNTENGLTQGHLALYFKNGSYTYSGMIFDSHESAKNYALTGSTDGMIKADDNPILDGFGDEYDSSVPIPQLTDLSHNGFKVNNNATTLELDLQVESYFYGLKHNDRSLVSISSQAFSVDKTQIYDEHTYTNIINSEIGFTGSDVVLTDETYFDCKNRLDLFSDGIEFFHVTYPEHKNLDSYSFVKHGSNYYTVAWATAKAAFSANEDLDTALDLTGQAVTKYYVRFRELRATDVAGVYDEVPGQWYCYTYQTGKAVSVSPIEGDSDGNPVETDPIWGEQDDDGNPVYDDSNLPDINTENPLEMLQGFLGLVTSLPDMVGELNLFLADTFCFIPEKYWTLILAGVGFSVVFLVFTWFKS